MLIKYPHKVYIFIEIATYSSFNKKKQTMSWTPERENKLKELWKKGHTASQIATLLGDTTRNAVIGKAHRLNLEARAASSKKIKSTDKIAKKTQTAEKKMSRKARFKSLLLDKSFEPENPKQLEELDEKTCKWPIGHPNEKSFYFCGRSSLKDFSYCKLHLLYAFQPKGKKEEDSEKNNELNQYKYIEKKNKSA